ncbi:unnamed protein product [Acanthoscelides obtectus]|uniref:Histone H2B n=1 Tax=Acanthoscelides obtectus TaxID=200917 RepID=A0A9P0QIX6_ACAOB|nr:unnamed protein product [Acanthoscelides obtectus]CAK1685417.1 hypothetical protein AOBTE_LOCUS35380 [Acanthoscelides obtectus]
MPPKTSGKAAKKAGKAQKNISKSDKKRSAGGRKVTQFTSTKSEAGTSRYGYIQQSDEHHEQLRQRYFRTYRCGSFQIGTLQQTCHDTSREIQTAVRLLLPGELAKHAVSEGTKAVTIHQFKII